jgi:hypothetical protein
VKEFSGLSGDCEELAQEILACPEVFKDDEGQESVRRLIKVLQNLRQELPDKDHEAVIVSLGRLLK